jgi:hypothetical protein
MKVIAGIISIAILSAAAELFLPWWMIAVVPFIVGIVMHSNGKKSFLAGFLGIAIFWLIAALMKDLPNEHILSTRMASVFGLPNYGLFMLVVVLVGGLIGGLSAWAGGLLREEKV